MKAIFTILASALFACTAAAAETTGNRWAFIDRETGRAVSGTITGLRDGTVADDRLAATVDVAPETSLLGTLGYRGGSVTTTGGVVSNAQFMHFESAGGGTRFLFGTTPTEGGYYPQVSNPASGVQAYEDEYAPVFVPLNGIINSWSFVDRATGFVVTGTISGLREGVNAGLGLVATVTSAPTADLLGLFAANSGEFTVVGGVVVAGNGLFNGSGRDLDLFMGTAGSRPYYPQITNRATGTQAYDDRFGMTFAAIGAVPEPASWAMMIAGFGLAGLALRGERRRLTPRVRAA